MLGFTPLAAGPLGSSGTQDYIFEVNAGVFAVSGRGAAKLITEFMPTGAYILDGRAAGFNKTMNLDLAAGSFASAFQDVIIDLGYGIVVDSETFVLTGQVANQHIVRGSSSGSFILTAQTAQITAQFNISAGSGSFVTIGQDVSERISEVVDAGSFILTAQTAQINAQFNISAGSGSFVTTGSNSLLFVSSKLHAFTGIFAITGQAAPMSFELNVDVGTGSIALSGSDITLQKSMIVSASQGQFILTGSSITEGVTEFTPPGEFSYAGQNADFRISMNTDLETVNFVTTGNVIPFKKTMNLDLAAGSFASAFHAITTNITEAVSAGTFGISLFDVTLTKVMNVDLDSTTFSYAGEIIKIQGWVSYAHPIEVWSATSAADDTWTEQNVSADTWTERNVSDDTWTERDVSDDTWTEQFVAAEAA